MAVNPKRILKIKYDKPTWEEALAEFVADRKADGLREATWKGYHQFNDQFFRWYPEAWESDEELERASKEWLSQEGISPSTYNLRLTYVRGFIRFCVEKGWFNKNPFEGRSIKSTEPRSITASMDTLQRLIRLPDRSTFTGIRDYAMILLELDVGLRPKELISVKVEHFNLEAQELFVPKYICKTHTDRTVHYSDDTTRAIRKYLSVRPKWWPNDLPMFCGSDGKPLNISGWQTRMKRYSKKLGINISPYGLRHIMAYQYLKNGGDLRTLQMILGHSTLEMTMHYIALTRDDIRENHEQTAVINRLMSHRVRNVG